MTIEECTAKIDELLNCEGGLIDYLHRETRKLMKSGAVDLESAEDDFRLPKVLLTAALERAADQYRPHDKKLRREVANLRHF